jgi:phosphoesterase RecJ-like protein
MIPPKKLLNFLKNEDNFIIAAHMNPDGDALGSSIALSMALQKVGKKTVLLCKDTIPAQYKFLPGQERFYTFERIQNSEFRIQDFKNLILTDCNDISRIMEKSQKAEQDSMYSVLSSLFSAVVDHHETENSFGNIRWIMPHSAATGLMVYHLIKYLGIEITEDMAVNLYSAIAVDTGNFRYENTSPEVFQVASELQKAGAKPHAIYRELYESWHASRFNLFMKVINTLSIEEDIAIVYVTRKMFQETSTSPDDTEHFVEFPRIMKNVNISVLFREIDDNCYKISLRSKDDINVAQIAASFGGGGHKNAAGFRINSDFETAKKTVISKLSSVLNQN